LVGWNPSDPNPVQVPSDRRGAAAAVSAHALWSTAPVPTGGTSHGRRDLPGATFPLVTEAEPYYGQRFLGDKTRIKFQIKVVLDNVGMPINGKQAILLFLQK
jgi:hypothetical protein